MARDGRRRAHRRASAASCRPRARRCFGGVYVARPADGRSWTCCSSSIALLTILFAPDYLEPRGLPMAEFTRDAPVRHQRRDAPGAAARTCSSCSSGLELLVLPGYMLAGFAKRDGLSTEGAIKYFLLGSFSSAILLFGLAFVFGYTGHDQHRRRSPTSLGGDRRRRGAAAGRAGHGPRAASSPGVAFKIAAVPFHYWTPDAYQGSPDARDRLPVGGSQGGRVRARCCGCSWRRSGPLRARLGRAHRRPRGAHHDRRQPRGAGPGQHQADAGLQLHRAHRLHHGRAGRVRGVERPRGPGRRPPGRAVLHASPTRS